MVRLLLAATLLTVGVACKKKGGDVDAASTPSTGGFIAISLDDEDEAFAQDIGSELMALVAECGDLVKMEPAAMLGKLVEPEIRCLEWGLTEAVKQTHKDKISRVLMNDAWAKGDTHRWESIVARHLDMVDRSDPDLVYKFSKHLSKQGAPRAEETIRWAEVALENRAHWSGDTHVNRVYALFKIRTFAAHQLWEHYETKYVENPGEEGLLDRKDEQRNALKTMAREWLEYARSSGRDQTLAMQLCVSAAANTNYCEEL